MGIRVYPSPSVPSATSPEQEQSEPSHHSDGSDPLRVGPTPVTGHAASRPRKPPGPCSASTVFCPTENKNNDEVMNKRAYRKSWWKFATPEVTQKHKGNLPDYSSTQLNSRLTKRPYPIMITQIHYRLTRFTQNHPSP
uniref:Uncharacterized protein n=1 Tax=Oryza punctata TaxID=4537 RepID=A0A0E0M111_ORYPU